MELTIAFLLIAAYFIFRKKDPPKKQNKNEPQPKKEAVEIPIDLEEIPDGYTVYQEQSFFVTGVTFRSDSCNWWVNGKNLSLSFKREPSNSHDENAIAIYGKNDQGSKKIGYVNSDIAYDIVSDGLDKKIKPRLISVSVGDAHFIEYEILVKEK